MEQTQSTTITLASLRHAGLKKANAWNSFLEHKKCCPQCFHGSLCTTAKRLYTHFEVVKKAHTAVINPFLNQHTKTRSSFLAKLTDLRSSANDALDSFNDHVANCDECKTAGNLPAAMAADTMCRQAKKLAAKWHVAEELFQSLKNNGMGNC